MGSTVIRSFTIGLLLLLFSCEKGDDIPAVPILYTGDIKEVDENGTVFSGVFKNIDPDLTKEFGFIWSTGEAPTNLNSLKRTFPLPPVKEIYTYRNHSSLIRDTTYYMRIFVSYPQKIYYGRTVSFYSFGSKPPELTGINPAVACFGDTIQITGKYLGLDTKNMELFFNEDPARILQADDEAIVTIVPLFSQNNSYFETGKISIKLNRYQHSSLLKDEFTLSPPEINSYTPSEGLSYTNLSIEGKGFHPDFTKIFIGDYICDITNINNRYINALLPPLFNDYQGVLAIEVANKRQEAGIITVFGPSINEIHPKEIFSYEQLTFSGQNLLNENLEIKIGGKKALKISSANDSMVVEVPGEICDKKLAIEMKFGNSSYLHNEKISFKQPENIVISREENNLFDGRIIIRGDYMPEIQPYGADGIDISLNDMNAIYFYNFNQDARSHLTVNIPKDVTPVKEWLNLDVQFCESTGLEIDSAFHIPAPEILNVDSKIYSLENYVITGRYFNATDVQNIIILGDYEYGPEKATNTTTMFLQGLPVDFEADVYPLKIITNGQESNSVNVEVVHRWNKITDLPEIIGSNPVAFYSDKVFYLGGGENDATNIFYSYDLDTREWNKKSNLPRYTGTCSNNSEYGYFFNDYLNRYNFVSDSWETLSGYKNIDHPQASFIYDNKFFVLSIGIKSNHYYYDLIQNEWVTFEGYTGFVSGTCYMQAVLENDKVYIFHDNDIYILNLANLTFEESGASNPSKSAYKSQTGFEYNGELYLYGRTRWDIYNSQSFKYRQIKGPEYGNQERVFCDGNTAYFIAYNSIWKFDLTMQ